MGRGLGTNDMPLALFIVNNKSDSNHYNT